MKQILRIAAFELRLAVTTKRAMVVMGLYLAAAVLGSLIYVQVFLQLERQILEALVAQGQDPTEAGAGVAFAADLLRSEVFTGMLSFFSGASPQDIMPGLKTSAVLPALLWSCLAFLPFLIVLTGFDAIASDVQHRTICYNLLRTSRQNIVLGKALAQFVLFAAVMLLSASALVVAAHVRLNTFDALAAAPDVARILLLLLPFGLCYVALVTFASACVRSPFGALVLALAFMLTLRFFGWSQAIWGAGEFHFLTALRYLSPAHYTSGFWLAGMIGPLKAVLAYLALTALFLVGAIWRLKRREL